MVCMVKVLERKVKLHIQNKRVCCIWHSWWVYFTCNIKIILAWKLIHKFSVLCGQMWKALLLAKLHCTKSFNVSNTVGIYYAPVTARLHLLYPNKHNNILRIIKYFKLNPEKWRKVYALQCSPKYRKMLSFLLVYELCKLRLLGIRKKNFVYFYILYI